MNPHPQRTIHPAGLRRPARTSASVLLAVLLSACSASAPDRSASSTPSAAATRTACAAPAARAALAPSGALRVGVYRGSPSSYVEGAANAPPRGVGWMLGRALAQQLQLGFEPVVFDNNAASLAAVQHGFVDLVFTNATAERAQVIRFAPPLVDVEKSVLVPAGSPIGSLGSLAGRAARIGVSAGSSTAEEFGPLYPSAVLVAVPTLLQAGRMLGQGSLDGFATNNAILFELADQVPGTRVLPGHWGLEHFALGIPPGRAAGHACIDAFSAQAAASGLLSFAIEESRLRGTLISGR
jgi:polar amino acid transport system substrate-binding protein